jgi:ABC-2 type transport system ATP-binding protein
MMDKAIETSQLRKQFGDFTAVDQVDFYIPEGEIFGLLGPNGAGKTTLIRMLCGIMRPSSGAGSVLGMDIVRDAEAIKKRIGYMSQLFSLYNDLTIVENLNFYASIYGVPRDARRKRVAEVIELTELGGLEDELTRNLSGAWRQRLALACAIAHRPPMLFLDEATAGVDPVSRRTFWDLIYSMAGEGVSVLATTHYMDEADYCNTIGMMYHGRLIAVASPDTLKEQQPGTLYQVDCDRPASAQEVLQSLPGVMDTSFHGALLHVTIDPNGGVSRLEQTLKKQGIEVRSIEDIQPSIEDVFLNLVDEERDNAQLEPVA